MGSPPTPAFRWSLLDITRGPGLPREADKVVRMHKSLLGRFERATTREDKENLLDALEALRASIENRIEELEEFYLQHDHDERAILFEKQRLKLRRLLHSDSIKSKLPKAASAPAYSPKPPQPPSTPAEKTPKRRVRSSQKKKSSSKSNNAVVIKSYEREPRLCYSTNKSRKAQFQKELNLSRAKMKSRVEPIYSWEKGNEGGRAAQHAKVQLFGPVEFQLVLTEQEFYKFCSKRRERAALLRHKKRNIKFQKKECKYLMMQGPYVDPTRILNSIYRSPDKSKWMDSKGIRGYQHL
jgi:hypothetical protein